MSKKAVEITIVLSTLDQLLTTSDPITFPAKGLDEDAHTYIYGEANTKILRQPVSLTVLLPTKEIKSDTQHLVQTILHQFFVYQEGQANRELSRKFREGRLSLVISFSFILICFSIAYVLHQINVDSVLRDLIVSALTIASWVALWQPVQIFLYDWWPIRRDRKVYKRLSQMDIKVVGR